MVDMDEVKYCFGLYKLKEQHEKYLLFAEMRSFGYNTFKFGDSALMSSVSVDAHNLGRSE